MKCVICKTGDTYPGNANISLQRGESLVFIKSVPADICENCGEYYLSEDITDRMLSIAESAIEHGAELEILRFAA